MRSVLTRVVWVSAAMLLTNLVQSQAGSVVSNLNQTQAGGSSIFGSGPPQEYAQSFTVGSTSITLGDIQIPLGAASGTFTPSAEVVTDNSGVPGSNDVVNLTVPTPISTSTSLPYPVETVTPTSSVVLSANTTYWLIVSATSTSSTAEFKWGFTDSTTFSGPGTLGNYAKSNNSGSTWTTFAFSTGPEMIEVDSAAAAVPEPASLVLLGLGVPAIIMVARRRLRRGS